MSDTDKMERRSRLLRRNAMVDHEKISIQQALDQRIPRVRMPQWNDNAYLRLPLDEDGGAGVIAELYDPRVQGVMGVRPGSQRIPLFTMRQTEEEYLPYEGGASEWEHHPDNYGSEWVEE